MRRDLFRLAVTAAASADDAEATLHAVERGRAATLLETLANREVIRSAAVPAELLAAEIAARAEIGRAEVALKRATRARRRKRIKSARMALDKAHGALQRVRETIQREAKAAADLLYPEAVALPRLQALLAPGDAAVIYGQTLEGMVAIVVRPKAVHLRPVDVSDEQLAQCRAVVASAEGGDAKHVVGALARGLIEPLALPGSVRRVLVAPEARLSYVPFSLLLPGRDVVSLPSATTFAFLRGAAAPATAGALEVLGVGDPDYSGAASALPPLTATRAEVESVAQVRLLGAEATEQRFLEVAASRPAWRAIHVACHGLVDPEHPMRSALALTPGAVGDGMLTCAELYGARMRAGLFVLSACETGTGTVFQGEGVLGLTRACMFAGAPRVLCSLWKVDDQATHALMTRFYALWHPGGGKAGLSAAAALRQAQDYVRTHKQHPAWAHPYYWAAWVLWGLPD